MENHERDGIVKFYWQDAFESERKCHNRQFIDSVVMPDVSGVRDYLFNLDRKFPLPARMRWLIVIEKGKKWQN